MEKEEIENQANLQKEEKDKILEEIKKREEDEEKAKTKQQKLISRLKKMEEKMVVGSQAIEAQPFFRNRHAERMERSL